MRRAGKRLLARRRNWWRRRLPSANFQKAVLKIGNYLIMLAVVMVALIMAVGIYRSDPILTTLQFALVSAILPISFKLSEKGGLTDRLFCIPFPYLHIILI